MIDFDREVYAAIAAEFARPITVIPVESQPGAAAYAARGDYRERPVDVQTEDGAIMSTTTKTIGVRLAEFSIQIAPKDRIVIDGTTFIVDDTDDDGQGWSVVTLKEVYV